MYLKRLELHGFKSFPEKISLDFKSGITCVVGPNGSGKSNISDAVRWVLGEQSAKSLRGSKMEDIIFAGTQNRKPLGFSQVSIVIDNHDKKIPIEFSDLIISRRVYRSGESEFLINNSNCRLKDIHEILMDTGIGREGYSIIGQGRIDEILNAKSEDRRFLFEEAAGIVKFRSRREESLNKLEKERINLIRVEDILSELESKLEPLEQQSETAKKYLALIEEQKFLKINIFLLDTARSETELNSIEEKILIASGQLEQENKIKQIYIDEISEHKISLTQKDEKYKSFQNDLIELNNKFTQKQADIKIVEEKNNFINQELFRLENEKENNSKSLKNSKEQISALDENIKNLKENIDSENSILAQKQQEFNSISESMKTKESEIENYNINIFEGYKNVSDIKSNINKLKNNIDSLDSRKNELRNEISQNNEKILSKEKEIKESGALLIDADKIYKSLGDDIERLSTERDSLLNELEKKTNSYVSVTNEINDKQSRYRVIKELEEDFEGYYNSTKAVLKQRKTDSNFQGIHGALGELIEVPQEFETAIEIALGGYIQNIVTNNENDAKIAIEFLKKNKQGRATFLPISSIKPYNRKIDIKEKGFIGIAESLVKYDDIYKNIISFALGSAVICDTLNNAIALNKKYNNSLKIVTLEGDLLSPGGAMTGGSINKKTTNIFGRAREIKQLDEKINELKKIQAVLKNENSQINQDLEKIKADIKEKKTLFYDKEKEINNLNHFIKTSSENLDGFLEKSDDQSIENKQLDEQIFEINKDLSLKEIELLEFESEIEAIKTKLSDFQNEISSEKDFREDKIKEITNIQINISAFMENLKSKEEQLIKLNNEFLKYQENIDNYIKKIEENKVLLSENKTNIENIKSDTDNFELLIINCKSDISKIENEKVMINKALEQKEAEANKNNDIIHNLDKEKNRLELKKEQIEENRRNLFDNIWEEYNMTYQQALKFPKSEESLSALNKKENSIRNQIKEMGNVNVSAIEEFKEVKERYSFLKSQKDDIVSAEESLKKLISELTEMMGDRFKSQFKIISDNFCVVFAEMFGGGKAYLNLLDEENVLESGIEIVAQPPGKRLQNMNLLSGGERALTAIALLFAILKMKPSPFCILDEIEAALDDSNVKRFADYIKNFSKDTQFIVITHRKGTMESADVLYGVTMQEQGVSKLVSVELKEYS